MGQRDMGWETGETGEYGDGNWNCGREHGNRATPGSPVVTAVQHVNSTRMRLGAAAAIAAVAWGVAVALGVLVFVSFASTVVPAIALHDSWYLSVAIVAGIGVTATLLWRARHLVSLARVALWIEERIPRLQYSLITAIEPAFAASVNSDFAAGLEATVARENISGVTGSAVRKTMLPAVTAVIVAAALLYMSAAPTFGDAGLLSRLGSMASGSMAAAGSRLEDLEVTVTPPSYTGARSLTLKDPSSVAALAGSRVTVTGEGAPDGLRASLGGVNVSVAGARRGWSVTL
nr:hypothetical protein [Gemmatimonadaceae bacterium]